MLQIPTGETVRIQLVDGLVVDEIPVGQELNLDVLDAVGTRLLERQLSAFEDELVVLIVTVHQDDLAGTVFDDVEDNVAGPDE